MKKFTLSLAFISTTLIAIFLFLVILPIIYWTYINSENTISKSINEYFNQTKKIVETTINQESIYLKNYNSNIVNNITNKDLKNINFEDINSIQNDDLLVDLVFLQYDDVIKDFSSSLFETKTIIEKIVENNKFDNLIWVNVDNNYYFILLTSKNVIDSNSGRIIGKVVVGQILNDNISLINKIKEKTNSKNISFMHKNQIIVTTVPYESIEYINLFKIDNLINKHNIYTKEDLIMSKQQLNFSNSKTDMYIISSSKNKVFDNLKNDFYNQFILIVVIFIIVMFFSYIMIKSIIINPSNQLLDFAKNIQKNENEEYENSIVSEYNNIADGLKNIIGELRDSKEQFQLAIDGTRDGLWDWDIVNKKVQFSNKFKEILGYNQDDALSYHTFLKECIHNDDYAEVQNNIRVHLEMHDKYYENEYRVKCKNGSYKWIKSRGQILFDKNDNPYRMLGFITDIQHMKELIEENEQKAFMMFQQSKTASIGETLGNIAHHWRQPLSIISTIATGLKMNIEIDMFDKDRAMEALTKLNSTTQNLSKTIDNFRNFYKPNKIKEEFDVKEVIKSNIELMRESYMANNITFILELTTAEIYTYKNEFIQSIINILVNSREAFLKNEDNNEGFIFINSTVDEDSIIIKIYDTAGGIENGINDKIYEPYFSTKEELQQTGLGLYITKEIIEKHLNGTITNKNIIFNYMDKSFKGVEFKITINRD